MHVLWWEQEERTPTTWRGQETEVESHLNCLKGPKGATQLTRSLGRGIAWEKYASFHVAGMKIVTTKTISKATQTTEFWALVHWLCARHRLLKHKSQWLHEEHWSALVQRQSGLQSMSEISGGISTFLRESYSQLHQLGKPLALHLICGMK